MKTAYREKRDTLSGEIWRFQKNADMAKMAEAMGCAAFRVEKPSELKALLPKAFAMNRPVLLDCISEEQALAPTAWLPGGGRGGY
ncbi:pyruvate dehydrogenase [compost metagenome]